MYEHLPNLHLAMCVSLIYSLPPPPIVIPDVTLHRYTTILLMVPVATSIYLHMLSHLFLYENLKNIFILLIQLCAFGSFISLHTTESYQECYYFWLYRVTTTLLAVRHPTETR